MRNTTANLDSLRITSAANADDEGRFGVMLYAGLDSPICFTPTGALVLAIRIYVAAELSRHGIETTVRIENPDCEDAQALVAVESYHSPFGEPCVQLTIGNFQIRTSAVGAVHLAARLCYAHELAQMGVAAPIRHADLNPRLIQAAVVKLRGEGALCYAATLKGEHQ